MILIGHNNTFLYVVFSFILSPLPQIDIKYRYYINPTHHFCMMIVEHYCHDSFTATVCEISIILII